MILILTLLLWGLSLRPSRSVLPRTVRPFYARQPAMGASLARLPIGAHKEAPLTVARGAVGDPRLGSLNVRNLPPFHNAKLSSPVHR